MLSPLMNLLIMQDTESANNGKDTSNIHTASYLEEDFRIIPANTAPRNVLPISPMNILDGLQFHFRNPNKAKTKGNRGTLFCNDPILRIINIHPATSPSIPSIKFVKLIIPVINKMRKGIDINALNDKVVPENITLIIKIDVNTCAANLI